MTGAVDIRDVPRIARTETWHLAATEWRRLLDLLGSLGPQDWSQPTDCTLWDVRALVLHLVGTAEGQASPREMLHQFWSGIPLNREIDSQHWVDGINELQIRDRKHLRNEEAIERLRNVAPKSVRIRRILPPPVRWMPVPMGDPIGWKPLTYLLRMGFTRDVWMHRIDLARATTRELVLTSEHDARIVADLVVEWARRHGEPFGLHLTGPAGGTYLQGRGGEELEIDAVEFCRVLSGRGRGSGLLRHRLPL